MKNKLIYFLLVLICCTCQSASDADQSLLPELDVQAVLMDEGSNGVVQVLLRMELRPNYGDLLKFGLTEVSDHQARLNYYQLGLKKDVYLLSGRDTIPCTDSHLERINMDAPYRNFVLTFLKDRLVSAPELLIHETQFTNQLIQLKILTND